MNDDDVAIHHRHPDTEKGYVRPVRQTYVHTHGCGKVTSMSIGLAQAYAREPKIYLATYCAGCHLQFPTSDFTWRDGGSVMGT